MGGGEKEVGRVGLVGFWGWVVDSLLIFINNGVGYEFILVIVGLEFWGWEIKLTFQN